MEGRREREGGMKGEKEIKYFPSVRIECLSIIIKSMCFSHVIKQNNLNKTRYTELSTLLNTVSFHPE